jgi:hypothetical protein
MRKKQALAIDRWKARRYGDKFCAPACGGGCTYAAFRLATRRATDLCKALGPGWKPDVWENLGWHYAAYFGKAIDFGRGLIEIHAHHDYAGKEVSYSALLQTSPQIGAEGRTPAAVVKALKKAMQKRVTELTGTLSRISETSASL